MAAVGRLASLVVLFMDLPPAIVDKDTYSTLANRFLVGEGHVGHAHTA